MAVERPLHIDDVGSGPAVVLLHGAPSSVEDFAPLVEALEPDHRVLVPHFPGYGRTPADPGPYSLSGVIARLEAELVARGVREAAIVGFSAGAYKAAAMALHGAIQVTRMVLLSPTVGWDSAAAGSFREMVAAARSGALDLRPIWLARMASPGLAERHPAAAARVLGWLDAVPLVVLCDELLALVDAPDLRWRMGELPLPVLVCTGAVDNAVDPGASEALAASCRHGTFARIDGAGHAALLEAPQPTVRLIADFLR